MDRDSGGRLRGTGEGEGESEGRGGSVICVSAALGPSAHPLPFLATSATTPARPAFYPFNHPRSTLRTGTMSADVSAWFGMCVAYMYARTRVWVCICVGGTRSRSYVRRAYVLHLTNITSIYSGLPYVPDM